MTDLEGQINLQMQAKFNEGVAEIEQQIIGASVTQKTGREQNVRNQRITGNGRGKSIDHTQLMVQNSPRNGLNPAQVLQGQHKMHQHGRHYSVSGGGYH